MYLRLCTINLSKVKMKIHWYIHVFICSHDGEYDRNADQFGDGGYVGDRL